MALTSRIESSFLFILLLVYQFGQWLTSKILAPNPVKAGEQPGRPRIAVIGAGITGVTAAAHCIGHGFDVLLFEKGGPDSVGGIWTKVNQSSGLQIHSIMYRFHPAVQWQQGYPDRSQILEQVRKLWKTYGLEERTKFHFQVNRTYQDKQGRWIINDPSNGRFDGIIAAVGTCGDPSKPKFEGVDTFQGEIYHSSELSGKEAKDKRVVIIGGGASAVEALEFATAAKASHVSILSRSDKWIIPRNIIVDMLLAFNIFGQETLFSFIPEFLLRKLFYRDLEDLSPSSKGLFTDTPMVNSDVVQQIRQGKASWVRGDILGFTDCGVTVNRRARGVPKGGPGHQELVKADMVILATGFKRPSLAFLPDDCFQAPYEPPNWYLQTFPVNHPSISAINCTYVSAIGTVANWHIGIYSRLLLMFLCDPMSRPRPFWMKSWIKMTKLLKASSPTGAFDFFTYLELLWWFVFCVSVNPFRWKWAMFVFFGVGMDFPQSLIRQEKKLFIGQNMDVGLSL